MSKPNWVQSDEQLSLWGEAIGFNIPEYLLLNEKSTAGFVNAKILTANAKTSLKMDKATRECSNCGSTWNNAGIIIGHPVVNQNCGHAGHLRAIQGN